MSAASTVNGHFRAVIFQCLNFCFHVTILHHSYVALRHRSARLPWPSFAAMRYDLQSKPSTPRRELSHICAQPGSKDEAGSRRTDETGRNQGATKRNVGEPPAENSEAGIEHATMRRLSTRTQGALMPQDRTLKAIKSRSRSEQVSVVSLLLPLLGTCRPLIPDTVTPDALPYLLGGLMAVSGAAGLVYAVAHASGARADAPPRRGAGRAGTGRGHACSAASSSCRTCSISFVGVMRGLLGSGWASPTRSTRWCTRSREGGPSR